MVEAVVKENINPDFYKFKKFSDKYKRKEDEIRKKYAYNVKKNPDNQGAYETELFNALDRMQSDRAKEYEQFNGYNPLGDKVRIGFTKCKKNVSDLSKKASLSDMDIMRLSSFISIGRYAFPENVRVNGKFSTGETAKKFIENLNKREKDKLAFAEKCARQGVKMNMAAALECEKLGDLPTVDDYRQLCEDINGFKKRIEKADDNMHVNSSEYKAMIKAYNNLAELIAETNGEKIINSITVGERLDALKKASVKYISAKGIGGQYTDLGKERLELALEIANKAFEYSEKFPSYETAKRAYVSNIYSDFTKCTSKEDVKSNIAQQFVVNGAEIYIYKADISSGVNKDLEEAYDAAKAEMVVEKKQENDLNKDGIEDGIEEKKADEGYIFG